MLTLTVAGTPTPFRVGAAERVPPLVNDFEQFGVEHWARENMAAYKAPKLVEFTDALPKSGSGKVMWRLLQDQEAGR